MQKSTQVCGFRHTHAKPRVKFGLLRARSRSLAEFVGRLDAAGPVRVGMNGQEAATRHGQSRVCRICFDSEETPSNPLLRPCRCRGSMAYVHCECLNEWRRQSVNPKSFYECDTCKFKYQFGTAMGPDRFTIARVLAWPLVIHALSILGLVALCFFGGFVAKMFDSSLTWYDVVRCFNVNHLLSGATATGLLSLFGWLTAGAAGLGGGPVWRTVMGNTWHGGTGGDGGKDVVSTILLVIAVVAGLCVALYWIYGRLEELSRQTVRLAQHVVLDVGADDDGETCAEGSGGGVGTHAHAAGHGHGDAAGARGEPAPRRVFEFVD